MALNLTLAYSSLSHVLNQVLVAAGIAALTLVVALFSRQSMRRGLKPRLPLHVYRVIENLVFYTVIGIGAIAILSVFGINLTGLLVAGGFAGLVVGLASQQAISNLVSGIFLLLEQPLRPGDPVSIGDIGGTVVDINIISTRIRTWDGYIVRIPNSKVFEAEITNYQRTKARRVEFEIGISYSSDIDKAIETILSMINEHPYCLVNPEPQVFVDNYADSSIVLKVRCWAPPQVWFNTKIELQTRIKKVLEEAGIEIPFPQLDLHVKDATPLRVEIEGCGLTRKPAGALGEGGGGCG